MNPMEIINYYLTCYQNQLIAEIQKNIPFNGTPITPSTQKQKNDFCIIITTVLIRACIMKKYKYDYHVFKGLCYGLLNEDYFAWFICDTAAKSGINLDSNLCYKIMGEVKLRTPESFVEPNDNRYSLCLNGYIDNSTGQIVPNAKNYFPTLYINASYLPDKQLFHPTMDKFLDDISGGDTVLIKRIWEVIGYCISSDCSAKRIFILVGTSGDNGKSTFLNFLCSLISWQGISEMSIDTLVGSRFSLSELKGKRLEVSADEGLLNLSTNHIAILKKLSGNDPINVEVKHKPAIRFTPTAKILIASNHEIGAAYTACDPAFSRRICSLPFDVKISKEQQDPYLIQKLDMERDAIVTEALLHYLELRNRNYVFTGDDIFDNNIWLYPNNPQYSVIADFSNRCCKFGAELFSYTQDIYSTFVNIYGNNVFKDITAFSQAFYRANENMLTKTKKHTAERNSWGFYGVTLKEFQKGGNQYDSYKI